VGRLQDSFARDLAETARNEADRGVGKQRSRSGDCDHRPAGGLRVGQAARGGQIDARESSRAPTALIGMTASNEPALAAKAAPRKHRPQQDGGPTCPATSTAEIALMGWTEIAARAAKLSRCPAPPRQPSSRIVGRPFASVWHTMTDGFAGRRATDANAGFRSSRFIAT